MIQRFDCKFSNCIKEADGSAAALVNLLVEHFPCFRDESKFEGKNLRFYKRAQILVADLWACFDGEGYGRFHDIDQITMFAGISAPCESSDSLAKLTLDYRIPQMLHTLSCLRYSPPLEYHIRQLRSIESGHSWEIQLRGRTSRPPAPPKLVTVRIGCSIWCVELIRREIIRQHPEAQINAILIDFFLYDTMKEREASGEEAIPHHRTRSIWY